MPIDDVHHHNNIDHVRDGIAVHIGSHVRTGAARIVGRSHTVECNVDRAYDIDNVGGVVTHGITVAIADARATGVGE